MNRRQLLTLAPVALAGCAAPAAAACAMQMTGTPVAVAFREWAAFRAHINGPATRGMENTDFDALVDDLDEIGLALLMIPSQTPQDFIMKVIASTDWGQGGMPHEGEMPELWAEASELIGDAL